MDDDEYEDRYVTTDVQPCASCGRTFVPETLVKHERICFKSNSKKRKIFDSSKQRVSGLEVKPVKQKANQSKLPLSKSKTNWRAKHEEFISTMRAAKDVTKAIKTGADLPPPPKPTINPDYVECPSCSRRFNNNAAERHIPWCKEKQKRISHPAKKSEGFKIRTQYKPPLPGVKKGSPSGPRTGLGMKGSKSSHEVASLSNGMDNMQMSRKPVNGLNLKKRSNSLDRKTTSTRETAGQRRSNSGGNRIRYADSDYDDDDRFGYQNLNNNSYRKDSRHSVLSPVDSCGRSKNPFSSTSTLPSIPKVAGSSSSTSSRQSSGGRASRFCHECGTRYPVSNAKFCCECGMKRMWIEE
ncbi:zinc finger C2HC domain-containing protein 1A-like isoform X2 [Anneissia japonica]|uniref:zinc finger C2HC domain-containing protein 1A-like isoform X2 n=1 Tax=Anneissia japonica TaxID=1529436 RepID=UPI001425AC2D|nr:zinc finger C2HC domain-containing protein 1A-like isoform X2 [Anneissia japonica]